MLLLLLLATLLDATTAVVYCLLLLLATLLLLYTACCTYASTACCCLLYIYIYISERLAADCYLLWAFLTKYKKDMSRNVTFLPESRCNICICHESRACRAFFVEVKTKLTSRFVTKKRVYKKMWHKTGDNGNAMFQSYLSKLFEKETG